MINASSILQETEVRVEPEYRAKLEHVLDACRKTLPTVDEAMIRQAFIFSYWAHRDGKRASGEKYISHPLEVALIVAERIGFDDTSVAAALLHDVVEDTELDLDFIRSHFGDKMETIIDGLTKIGGVFTSHELGQAENVRKLMLSMASDVRVILVKFADRLHNMRTLESLPKQKRMKIASETIELFAPLAHRFGLFAIKSELEDLSLKVLEPDTYRSITAELRATKEERDAFVRSFIEPLRQRLAKDGFEFDIYGRSKNVFSIYQKMKRQNKPIDEIYDLFAIRIVLKSEDKKGKEDCWRVYSIITDLYKPLPERFRDFISMPKGNGYQSLHTTVLGPDGRRVEVQIRTQQMHEIAERGFAAHWKYKEGVSKADDRMETFLSWIRDLLDSPKTEQATDFVKDFRLNLYHEEIYVFTPKGDLFTLPTNATPVDFAFHVHTEVGFHCIGAKINGKMVPLSYRLRSGDQVEIITSKRQTPSADWMNFVVTHKAQSRIRHWINEKRRKSVELGIQIWKKKAKKAKIVLSDHELLRAVRKMQFSNLQQMYFEIGVGLCDVNEVVDLVLTGTDDRSEHRQEEKIEVEDFLQTVHKDASPALIIDGQEHTDIKTRYAMCCNPIPGDNVFGYISRAGIVSIHRVSCRNATDLMSNHGDRIVQVEWSRQKEMRFVTALRIVGEDRVGMISDLTTVISKNLKTNIRSITVNSEDGIFEGTILLYVSDLEHLRRLVARLKKVTGVHGVYRLEEQHDGAASDKASQN